MNSEWSGDTGSVEMKNVRPLQLAHIAPASKVHHNSSSLSPKKDSFKPNDLTLSNRAYSGTSEKRESEHATPRERENEQPSRQSFGFSFGNFGQKQDESDGPSPSSITPHSTSRRTMLPPSRPSILSNPEYSESDYISVRNLSNL